jgi:predicted secreted protein
MSWATGAHGLLVIWWTILFAVLPLGVKRVENPDAGQDPRRAGAAAALRKAIITSWSRPSLAGLLLLHQNGLLSASATKSPEKKSGGPVRPPLLSYPEVGPDGFGRLSSLKLRPAPKA